MRFFGHVLVSGVLALAILGIQNKIFADDQPAGDALQGKAFFQRSCATCHADNLGPGNTEIVKQGPSLVNILGRHAASETNFNYSPAMKRSGLVWDAPTLEHFLAKPTALVPGTTMPIAVASPADRSDVIAYLSTLHGVANAAVVASPVAPHDHDPGDWRYEAPGVKYHVTADNLAVPFATRSAGNPPRVIQKPDNATLSVPPGFKVQLFATGFTNPRIIRVAPNGDIFVAETAANRVRILRAADGADTPTKNQIFAEGLDQPFGIAFYPPGPDPKWIYIANNNSVVRFPYHNGDLKATGAPEVIVPKLTDSGGGHSTRDIAFSQDGKRLFISVGSASNVGEGLPVKSPEEIRKWEADHGKGAAWDYETNRADILVTDPEGKLPLHTYATGIRNGVGIAVEPATGKLWTSTNERDGLGDDLVPEYITSVKEGGYYGWPWYYIGNHEDPRRKGERPDLAGQAIIPDVLMQAHSASLGMCFYDATSGAAAFPAEYRGNIFAAEHGSWNRSTRTGYKVVRVLFKDGVATGEYEDFLTGFVVDNSSVWGRPVGVAVAHDGALLITEDGNGTIWRVAHTSP